MIYLPKTQPAPPNLAIEKAKANGTYNCEGVLDLLKSDFKNKCYLCEDKEPHSINTEHFRPHRGNKDLKFDWNNLFFCCAHCNNTKLANPDYDLILNCTIERDNVETIIRYHIDPLPKEKAIITALEDTQQVVKTVDLLHNIYNGTTELKIIESANLRSKLLKEIRNFHNLLFAYYDDSNTEEELFAVKNQIIRELRSTSNFTAFKRWIIRDCEGLKADFIDYF